MLRPTSNSNSSESLKVHFPRSLLSPMCDRLSTKPAQFSGGDCAQTKVTTSNQFYRFTRLFANDVISKHRIGKVPFSLSQEFIGRLIKGLYGT